MSYSLLYSSEMRDGINRFIHYTNGIFGNEGLQACYKVEELPIIHNIINLALLNMREVHRAANNLSLRKFPLKIIVRMREFAVI